MHEGIDRVCRPEFESLWREIRQKSVIIYFNLISARKNVADSRKYGWPGVRFGRGRVWERDVTVLDCPKLKVASAK
jgi:hypothetical protein